MKKFRAWLFGKTTTARMARSFILTLIPLVCFDGMLSLDLVAWKVAALSAAAAALTPFAVALQVADDAE